MGKTVDTSAGALGCFEPSLQIQFLPGCPCGSAHPIALNAADPNTCPGCGKPARKPGQRRDVDATFTLRSIWILPAKLLLQLGQWLRTLAQRIEP